ncbi:hypothetical protein BCR41DRAFT_354790 [Lobosporangium transversale]|uniref:Uncharacterized protein n=1 Tax=Lobosporangium transversale TaxID=64571 RepID=A0A1Y2GLK6_9FUNG|nr:hypothetical protein BCR41DRAFT_354790 [Lobosporangium transversale]ORZ14388.1 hypothetical protein BCR41DRAFT_354790 [Lobosporangium transversale]|eukprot:XP_021880866.1 hypothetical protein BCR41DRAFT_354790 [Lobosporangium transversale]
MVEIYLILFFILGTIGSIGSRGGWVEEMTCIYIYIYILGIVCISSIEQHYLYQ